MQFNKPSHFQKSKLNKTLLSNARDLRYHMTPAELKIWYKIRGRQLLNVQFYRQAIIENFIVDFFAPEARLIIEVDGGQHFEQAMAIQDAKRDAFLNSLGYKVLRFNNNEVLRETQSVLESIYMHIEKRLKLK